MNKKISTVKRGLFTFTITSIISLPVWAGIEFGELDGFYVPVRGWAETQEISRSGELPTQIGTYSIILRRQGWNELSNREQRRIRRRLVLEGPLKGEMNDGFLTLNHVLGTKFREGAIYTEGDYLIPLEGDCNQEIPLSGTETLNFKEGTGKFSGLSNGTIEAEGTINNCPGLPNYLKNDFRIVPYKGGLSFQPIAN